MHKKYSSSSIKIPKIREKKGILTVAKMLTECSALYGDRIAYSIPKNNKIHNISFKDVHTLTSKFAYYLNSLGLKKDDHIAILGENSPEWVISYFATNWIGSVAVPLDARANIKDIKNILNFSDSNAVIVSPKFFNELESIKNELPNLNHIINMKEIENLTSKESKMANSVNSNPDDTIEILFTSGTTGNPKGVTLTNRNIMSNVEDIYSFLEIGVSDRAFSILPIHHSYEKSCGIMTTFYSGVNVFFARSIKPREMLEDLKEAKPTIWLTAPLILEKLYQRITKELNNQKGLKSIITKIVPKKIIGKKIKKQLGLERIKLIVCGGATLPARVSEGLASFGFPIIQGYGLSETSPLISANPPSNPNNSSVGMIIESDEVVINDIDSEGNGEITVRGPNIMKGYYKNEEATSEILNNDGWLRTGDIGYFDNNGYLYITGRKKSVIVTKGGKNIYPEEIEEKLSELDTIEEAVVFSQDDQKINSIIFPSFEYHKIDIENLNNETKEIIWKKIDSDIRTLNKSLEIYKRISAFAITFKELPKTTTRKIKRFELENIDINKSSKFIDI